MLVFFFGSQCIYKNIWCVLGFTVLVAVHLQNANAKFHKVVQRHYSGELKTFKLLYRKYIQDNVYQILSESTWFAEDMTKTFWCVFFSSQCILAKKRSQTTTVTSYNLFHLRMS